MDPKRELKRHHLLQTSTTKGHGRLEDRSSLIRNRLLFKLMAYPRFGPAALGKKIAQQLLELESKKSFVKTMAVSTPISPYCRPRSTRTRAPSAVKELFEGRAVEDLLRTRRFLF